MSGLPHVRFRRHQPPGGDFGDFKTAVVTKRRRQQKGYVFKKGKTWYLRYYDKGAGVRTDVRYLRGRSLRRGGRILQLALLKNDGNRSPEEIHHPAIFAAS
jgi:hypothetical protein